MNIDIRFYLALIIALLIVISILIFLLFRLIKKYFDRTDWRMVYPELGGMHHSPISSFVGNSITEDLDQMKHEEPIPPPTHSHLEKFKNDISNELRTGNTVLCTAYSPEVVEKEEEFIVAAFVSPPEQKEQVEAAAQLIDDELIKRVEKFLNLKVKNGEEISFLLHIDGCEIDDPTQSIIWQGELASVEFGVKILPEFNGKKLLAKMQISMDGIPVGNIKFRMQVEANASYIKMANAPVEATTYKNAFISYASADRDEVLRRTQMLSATGISFFQDILQLKPGELWEKSLYKQIDNCDVFFLFWSTSAKNSKWVMEEYKYAQSLQLKGIPIEIIPVPIEGPPAPEPPEELSHLHFNDGFLYFIRN
jgi:hypothetical protein